MKKSYYLIMLALILGLVLTGCSLLSNVGQVPTTNQSGITYLTKHTEGAPFVIDLIADGGDPISATDVGDVLVWNDGDTLYVQYVVTAPWCLTETHLHVFLNDNEYTDVPQKNGNPIPGKFDYKGKHDCLADYTYEIPLDWVLGTPLYIAAHAKVIRPIDDCNEPVWQIGDVEGDDGTGHLTNYCDEFNYAYFYEGLGPLDPPFTNPFVVGTTPTNEFPWLSLAVAVPPYTDSPYATDFKVQWFGELLPFGGKLTVSWSPGQSAKETKIIMSMDDEVLFTFVEYGIYDPSGWRGYPLMQSILELDPICGGSHEIHFQHTTGDGAIWDWVLLEKPCVREETAWAAGFDFPGKNWATYFTYDVQGWEELGTITVPADGTIVSSVALDSGGTYKLVAEGTYIFANWSGAGIADAKYSLRPPGQWYSFHSETVNTWVSGVDLPPPWTHYLEVWGGDPLAPLDWDWDGGDFNPGHSYTVCVTGDGSTMQFRIIDNAYGDNSGFLTVTIYKWE